MAQLQTTLLLKMLKELNLSEQKLKYEIQKTLLEIDEIKNKSSENTKWQNIITNYTTPVASILAAVSVGWALFVGASTYLEQRKLAFDIQLTREMIDLSKQLSSNVDIERNNAAILISAYEEHAVPILVRNLRVTHPTDFADHLIESLSVIMEKERIKLKPEIVLEPLIQQTLTVFAAEHQKTEYSLPMMVNHLTALGSLATNAQKEDIVLLLSSVEKIIQSKSSEITVTDRERLLKIISETVFLAQKNPIEEATK